MKVPLNWLNEFIIPAQTDVKLLAENMTMTGSKVEGIYAPGNGLTRVVVGEILSVDTHKDSDHLFLCKVSIESKVLDLVTGAANIKAGDKVPVALDGAVIAGGVVINTGIIRGEVSEGMMCSLTELGFDSHFFPDAPENGIYVLPETSVTGDDIRNAMLIGRDIIEFEITSNRPDCFSVEGLAREAAITQKAEFRELSPVVRGTSGYRICDCLKVRISDPDLCTRYIARGVKNIRIAPSPLWMQARLRESGVRPINNIVDITNYVMLELGQPMHAFDYTDINGSIIDVRRAKPGEKMTTLDGEMHELDTEMLVIANTSDPMGMAGIMGGANSSISETTESIVFESANFDGINIRLSAKRLGIRTESSVRFEKGLDPVNAKRAIDRACELVELLECGEVSEDEIDVWPVSVRQRKIRFDHDRINSFLGTSIEKPLMNSILEEIGCELISKNDEMICIPPSFRNDLERDVDLAEEIARFYGYNKIKPTLLTGKSATPGGYSPEQKQRKMLASIMLSAGFCEACTYSFISPGAFDDMHLSETDPLRDAIRISNPLGEDYSLMRTTMMPSMLDVAQTNISRGVAEFNIFEIAKIYIPVAGSESGLPEERDILAAVSYSAKEKYADAQTLFRLKGIAQELIRVSDINSAEYIPLSDDPSFHPGRTMIIEVNGENAGVIGYIHPEVARRTETDKSVVLMMLEIRHFLHPDRKPRTYKPLPRFPAVSRDLALLTDRDVLSSDITKTIMLNAGIYLESCELFDIYTGKQISDDKKSMAYKLTFRSSDRTLSDEDINPSVESIIKALRSGFNAELR